MWIKITISGDGYDSEFEFESTDIYTAELNLLLTSLRRSAEKRNERATIENRGEIDIDKVTMASIIGGVLSIGIDLAIKTYGTIRTKRITKQFIDDCLGWE